MYIYLLVFFMSFFKDLFHKYINELSVYIKAKKSVKACVSNIEKRKKIEYPYNFWIAP